MMSNGSTASPRGANCGLLGSYIDSPPVLGGALRGPTAGACEGLYEPTAETSELYELPTVIYPELFTDCMAAEGGTEDANGA